MPFLAIAWLAAAAHAFAQSDQLLEPEDAFRFSAYMSSPERIEITWKIADGYYMYKQRFSVRAVNGEATLSEPIFPPGKVKHDELFGEVETFEHQVDFAVPVTMISENGIAANQIEIEVVGQGCNEPVGVCYPPLKQRTTLQVASADAEPKFSPLPETTQNLDSLGSLQQLLGEGLEQPSFLHPDEAFSFKLSATTGNTVRANFEVAEGYYLYKDKVGVSSRSPQVRVQNLMLPKGVHKTDEYFGEIEAYYDGFDAHAELTFSEAVRTAEFLVTYQGCAEDGICYPPIEKSVTLKLIGISDAVAGSIGSSSGPGVGGGGAQSILWPLLVAFGAGLLLTFTPCVLPMIPILGGIVAGQRGSAARMHGGLLAGIYVLGTAVTYAAIGVVAGLTGEQLQAYFQNAWAIGAVALILSVLALAMFGVYHLQMPSALQTWLQTRVQRTNAGAVGGVFAMGLMSALIVGACVSPVLISVLTLAIERGDPLLGGATMFFMALGMGVFLVLVGWGVDLLPKAGLWMDRVNHLFGFMLLAVAIYLLGAIPEVPVLYLWALLFLGISVYLVAFLKSSTDLGRWASRSVAVLALVWGALSLVGAATGNRDVFRPIAHLGSGGGHQAETHSNFQRIKALDDVDHHMQLAGDSVKPVLLDYYADWCVDCVRMEKSTFQDARVAKLLNERFILLQADVTDPNDAGGKAIKKRYGVFGPPAMLFFDRNGNEVPDLRRYGYMDAEEFLKHIEPLLSDAS